MKRTRRLLSITAMMAASLIYSSVRAGDLIDAVKIGDLAAVNAAKAAGADVNEADLSGTALHLAVATGNLEIVETLAAAGANLEAKGEPAGAHPLQLAAQIDESVIATALVRQDALLDARDAEGRTALMVAAVNGSLGTLGMLLDEGANPNAEDAIYHDTSAHFAAWTNRPEVLELLLSGGADLNRANPVSGRTPLHYAAMDEKTAAVEFLMTNGADPAPRDRDGKTAGELAGSSATAELLRTLGAPD